MGLLRLAGAFLAAVAVALTAASVFYTQQVLAKQTEIGAVYTKAQAAETYLLNFVGLAPAFGGVLALAFVLGFVVATYLKRILKPLAPIAYPVAGAAAVLTAIYGIENMIISGSPGIMGGARDTFGLALQGLAGALGGLVFALLRRRPRAV